MHYSSHPPRAFRNRIAKSIGVLVAAALVAVLGLPTAAQAQAIEEIKIVMPDSATEGLMVEWGLRGSSALGFNRWIVTFTEPGTGDELVVTDAGDTDADADIIQDAELGGDQGRATTMTTLTLADARARVFNDGLWEAQVTACYSPAETADGKDEGTDSNPLRYGVCAAVTGEVTTVAGAAETYLHGAPMMPMNLGASMIPGGVALTWMTQDGDADYGHMGYDYAMDDGDWMSAGAATASGSKVISDVKPGEHMFHVRAKGSSDSDRNTDTDEIFSAVATVTYMMPMPTPTLTESAALLLGLMLMGGGMYYIRRRQSGGLTHA